MLLSPTATEFTPALLLRSLGRSAGLIAAAMILCVGSAAQAAFTAYNDCVYDSTVPSGTPVHSRGGETSGPSPV